jgi:hypothetical protein
MIFRFRRVLLIVVVIVSIPVRLWAQAIGAPPADPSRFVLFIHAGGGPAGASDVADNIAAELARRGYVVRAPDEERNAKGGPGVDYFSAGDRPAAQDVANTVNAELKASANAELKASAVLQPRLQNVKNPPGYIGVWLFK